MASFFKSGDVFQKWKYRVTELIILFGNGKSESILPERINSICITHQYEKNLFPIMQLKVVMEPSLYYDMLKDKNKVRIKIRIQQFYTLLGESKPSALRDYINDVYDLILDDDDFDVNEARRKEEKSLDYTKSTNDKRNEAFSVDDEFELYLQKSKLVESANKTHNFILSNATVTDAIAYILGKSGFKKVLMSPITNKRSYPELVIPPLKTKQIIQHLAYYYGLYKNENIFYIDFVTDVVYILNRSGKCTAWRPKEIKEVGVLVPATNNPNIREACTLNRPSDKSVKYVVADPQRVTISNETVSINAYSSVNSVTVDSYSGESENSTPDVQVKGSATTTVVEDKTENDYLASIRTSYMKSLGTTIEAALGDYDASVLEPNKQIKVLFEDSNLSKKHKGTYVLAQSDMCFLKDGNDFSLTSQVVLRKK